MNTSPEGNMAPQGGWFSRNWKWAVPVGCLGILASCGCLAVIAGALGFNAIKNNTAYVQALGIAMADDEVQATLGTPIDTSFMGQQSSVKIEGGRSVAQFAIPLKGPKAEGTLRVDAIKTGEEWTYQVFQVDVPGHEPIDLRHKVGGPPRDRQMAPPTPDAPPPAANDAPPPGEKVMPEDSQDEGEGGAQGESDTPM